jgi:cytochrome b6-f complex iron-sulfur subunit
MERKEFLAMLGASAGLAVLGCLGACKKESTASPQSVNFTLDLSDPANSVLTQNGGYLVRDGVIVAKTSGGEYIAVAAACTHQGTTLQYQGSSSRFFCPNHGSTFSNSGAVINGPATSSLKKYNTSLNGNSLRIFS